MAQRLAVGDLAHGQIARNAMCQGYVIPLQLLTRPIVGCFRPHILGLPNEKTIVRVSRVPRDSREPPPAHAREK